MSEKKKREYGKEILVLFAHAVGRYRWLVALAFIGMFLVQVTALLSPLYLRTFFNTLVTGVPTPALVESLMGTLLIIAALAVANWIFTRMQFLAITFIDARVMRDLYEVAFGYLIRHSHRFFSDQFAGTLTRRVSRLPKSFEGIFDGLIMQFIPTTIFIAGAVSVLTFHNATLGIALLVWVIVFVSAQLIAIRYHQPLRIQRTARDSELSGALADAIGNQSTVLAFSSFDYEASRVREVATRWYHATIRVWTGFEYTWGVLGFLMVIINVGLLYGALHYWSLGMLTIGDFVLIQAYLLTTFDRLMGISRELRHFSDAVSEAGEMVEILETPHEISDVRDAVPLAVHDAEVKFDAVTFRFAEGKTILEDFNLIIGTSEKVALVGPSGAGKSTITRLLMRFYDVTGGSIAIDGQDTKLVTQESLRDAISFVPQEPILFHRTLMENIRYGRRDATDEEVIEAAKQAHCYDFVMATPQKFETFVGERGIKLSGGERQRIAIARAILKNAPILILDEATSSLDSESEALIQDALTKLMEGKTVIAIAHRLSTVMRMDRIIVIEDGKVATIGTHDELVSHDGGLYKKLWEIQAGGFIQDDIGEGN